MSDELFDLDSDASALAALEQIQEIAREDEKKHRSESKGKVKPQKWMSDDQPDELLSELAELLRDEAEEEELQIQEVLRQKEEERKRQEEEEEQRRLMEAQQKLLEEQRRQQELEMRRTQIAQAIEREKKIEAGEIDPEEEARKKKEEEELRRKAQEAEEKERALKEAQQLIQEQKEAIDRISRFEMPSVDQIDALPKRNALPIIIAVVAVVALAIGGLYFLMLKNQQRATPPKAPEGIELAGNDASMILMPIASYPNDSFETVENTLWEVSVLASEDTSSGSTKKRKPSKRRRRRKKSSGKSGTPDFSGLGGKSGGFGSGF